MVRISANTSKPSNVHPRFEAISVFYCVQLSERYHEEYSKVADDPLMIASLKFAKGRTSHRQAASQAYDNVPCAWNSALWLATAEQNSDQGGGVHGAC